MLMRPCTHGLSMKRTRACCARLFAVEQNRSRAEFLLNRASRASTRPPVAHLPLPARTSRDFVRWGTDGRPQTHTLLACMLDAGKGESVRPSAECEMPSPPLVAGEGYSHTSADYSAARLDD